MLLREKTKNAFYSCTFIINPTRFPEYSKQLKRILKRIEVPLIIESRSKQHFVDSVRAFCSSDHRHLLVWGGDGTAHDAINTFTEEAMKHPELRREKIIGFLRGGSGNGIQDSYEVPWRTRKQIEEYAESAKNNYVVDVDLLEIEHGGRISYCQLVGFGFDARVLENRAERIYSRGRHKGQIRRGTLNYFKSVFLIYFFGYTEAKEDERRLDLYDGKYSFKGTRVNAEFPFDHLERNTEAIEIEIGSRPYYGKLFKICPDVVCNDGYLDVYLYNFENRLAIVKNLFWLWSGKHDRINKKFAKNSKALIERYEVKRVDISSPLPFTYHVDGEVRKTDTKENGRYTVRIRVLPRQITFIVPGSFYRKFHPFTGI